MTEMVNIHEAKTQLSRILQRVEAGERIIIARAGKPVADLVPHHADQLRLGALTGRIEIADGAFSWPNAVIADMFYKDHAGASAGHCQRDSA